MGNVIDGSPCAFFEAGRQPFATTVLPWVRLSAVKTVIPPGGPGGHPTLTTFTVASATSGGLNTAIGAEALIDLICAGGAPAPAPTAPPRNGTITGPPPVQPPAMRPVSGSGRCG